MVTALAVAQPHRRRLRRTTRAAEQRQSYRRREASALRLETQLAIARHADLFRAGAYTELAGRARTGARLLAGYLVYLDRQLAETPKPHRRRRPARVADRYSAAAPSVPLVNRSTRSTARSRASDAGFVPTTRCAVLDRCDEVRSPGRSATSRTS